MSLPPLTVAASAQGGFAVNGAIGFDNAAEALRAAPQPAPGTHAEVDLAALAAPDSASLAVLIAWSAKACASGSALRYRNAPQALRNLARLSDVDSLLGLSA